MIQETVARLAPDSRLEQLLDHQQRAICAGTFFANCPSCRPVRSSPSRSDATRLRRSGWRRFCFCAQTRRPSSACFPPTMSSATSAAFAKIWRKPWRSPRRVKTSSSWESIRPGPRPGMDILKPANNSRGKRRALRVRRFTEKPKLERAVEFLEAGNFFWNSGMFVWSAATLAAALREHLPKTAPLLEQIAAAYGTRRFSETFRRLYPKCENISIDYAVLEPRSAKGEQQSNIFCIRASFGWNDLGSWSALHEHRMMTAQTPTGRRQPYRSAALVHPRCGRQLSARARPVRGRRGRQRPGGGGDRRRAAGDHSRLARRTLARSFLPRRKKINRLT